MRFFILEPIGGQIFGTKWAYAEKVDPVILGEPRRCPVCNRPTSLKEWLPPHRIKLSSAKQEKWGDFLWVLGSLAVSERFREIYQVEGLRGIEHFYPPMEIVRVGARKTGDLPSDLPTYFKVRVLWNGANLDDKESDVIRKENPLQCMFDRGPVSAFDRVKLEPESWNGSDIFEARGLFGVIIVSERFREVVEKYTLKNAWLIPAENYAYREIGGWYVRDSDRADDFLPAKEGSQESPDPG